MGTPRRPRPQLARTNAMRNTSYSADAGADGDDDDFVAYAAAGAGGGFASETSFRIRGGRRGAEEVAELFRKLGLSGPEDFAIPPAVYAAAMSHLPHATRRRASLEEDSPTAGAQASSSSSSPSDAPETSGRDVAVATRLHTSGQGEEAVLATESVQSDITQVSVPRTYQTPGAESKSRVAQQKIAETSTSKVTAASKPGRNDKPAKVETLRKERRREVAVETTRETTGGALAVVVAESTSADIEHLVSPSPHRRFRRTITSWIKGGHIGSGSFGSVYEAISE